MLELFFIYLSFFVWLPLGVVPDFIADLGEAGDKARTSLRPTF